MARYSKKTKETSNTKEESVIIPSMVVTPEETIVVEEMPSKVDKVLPKIEEVKIQKSETKVEVATEIKESLEIKVVEVVPTKPKKMSFEELYACNLTHMRGIVKDYPKKIFRKSKEGSSEWNPIVIGEK